MRCGAGRRRSARDAEPWRAEVVPQESDDVVGIDGSAVGENDERQADLAHRSSATPTTAHSATATC